MLILPAPFINLLQPFALLFHTRTLHKAQVLLIGAILTPRKRTVTSALRVMGLAEDASFSRYHHILNRAVWSPLKLSHVLLHLLLQHLGGTDGPLVFGIDETLERRWGRRISARGIYRDAVRSSKSHFVKASGLRWVSLMWLTYIPWANRTWALPVLTALAPSERYYEKLGRDPKKLSDWARQSSDEPVESIIFQLRRWLPDQTLIIVADASYAVLELLDACRTLSNPVTFITRLRLDAALYEPAEPRIPGQMGRTRLKGKRLPTLQTFIDDSKTVWSEVTLNWYDGTQRTLEITSDTAVWYHSGKPPVPIRWVLIRDPLLETQALLCTDIHVDAVQIIEWFVLRWQLEVTFQELRAHLGVESQRQWSDLAIARTTPLLFGLFSWVTMAAHVNQLNQTTPVHFAAWYEKTLPTFSDAIASVRRALWPASVTYYMSPANPEVQKVPSSLIDRLVDTLCYAA